MKDPLPADPGRRFDVVGAVLSATGMIFLILGILQIGTNTALVVVFLSLGILLQLGFFVYIRSQERAGKEPLLSTSLFHSRVANLAMITQNIQWLLLMGSTFVVSVYLQVVKGYSAIKTGVIFSAATAGILASSLAQQRLARKRSQRALIQAGFALTLIGIVLLLFLYKLASSIWVFAPGLLIDGSRSRPDADAVGQCRAVRVSRGETGRDLRTLTSGLQPRFIDGHGDRRARSWLLMRRRGTPPTPRR